MIIIYFQNVEQRIQLISQINMSLKLKEDQSHYNANILQLQQQLQISSGTSREQMTFLNTCWGKTNTEEIRALSFRRDFTLKCHQIQFHWWSRICVCLTLLCTTVLWGPLWLKHIQLSYKNLKISAELHFVIHSLIFSSFIVTHVCVTKASKLLLY